MATPALSSGTSRTPSVFDDFFKPWNQWFDETNSWGRSFNLPAVNITEQKDGYLIALAVPGLKKEDLHVDVEANMMTISSEKEETKEEKEQKFTRKEYNYSSFSRSFTLPTEVNKEKIEASYSDGMLNIFLPRKEETKQAPSKQIAVK